ncbi:hypothetical protein O9993_18730 [Vibrio lentus]|nr:hypothetical protein [Vibrio lentus]
MGKGQSVQRHKPCNPRNGSQIESGEIENKTLFELLCHQVSKLLKEQNIDLPSMARRASKYVENSDALATDNTRVNLWDTVF